MSKKIMGIYKITNIENNKCYIGSSKNLKKRLNKHLGDLRNKSHHNQHLQNSFYSYGELAFNFSVLEYIDDITILLEREQYYLDLYKSYDREKGYNILPVAGSSENMSNETRRKISESNKGRGVSEDTRQKISNSLKGRNSPMAGKNHTQDAKDKMSKSHKGKPGFWTGKNHNKETKDKMVELHADDWIVITPNGEEMKITNLKGFCRDNNLDDSSMVKVSKGKQSTHKKWKCKKVGDD